MTGKREILKWCSCFNCFWGVYVQMGQRMIENAAEEKKLDEELSEKEYERVRIPGLEGKE